MNSLHTLLLINGLKSNCSENFTCRVTLAEGLKQSNLKRKENFSISNTIYIATTYFPKIFKSLYSAHSHKKWNHHLLWDLFPVQVSMMTILPTSFLVTNCYSNNAHIKWNVLICIPWYHWIRLHHHRLNISDISFVFKCYQLVVINKAIDKSITVSIYSIQ